MAIASRVAAILITGACFVAPYLRAESRSAEIIGGTVLGGLTAAQRLEQIYYLGTFDPDDRVPPTFFRVRVRGQASLISQMKFGSGWVPATITDGLADNISYGNTPPAVGQGTSPLEQFGQAFVQYGPEGFRTVPNTHRLVLVMGQDPKAFFEAVDQLRSQMNPDTPSPKDRRQQEIVSRMEKIEEERKALAALKEASE